MKLASNDKAMKVIENWKITNNTDVTYVKSPNPINFFVNIAKNATNLLIFNKKDQLKDKKRHWKKRLWQLRKKILIYKILSSLSSNTKKKIKMRGALVSPPHILPCCSNTSKMVNALTLDLPMVLSFVNFETIL